MQRLRDSQAGRCQQTDQRRIGPGLQGVGRWKLRGGEDEAVDLIPRINVRDATRLPIGEVVRRRRFVAGVVYAKVLSKAADGLVTRVSLRDRFRPTGPVDRGCCADMLSALLSVAKPAKLRRRYSALLRVKPAARRTAR